MRVIYETSDKKFRIIEKEDLFYDLDDLKGDCYNSEVNPEIANLKQQEQEFERLVAHSGVFGYELEIWNSAPGRGYEHVDSCWGFVGMYSKTDSDETFSHYIVDEMKNTIAKLVKGNENETL